MCPMDDDIDKIGLGVIDEYRESLPILTPTEVLVVLTRDFSRCVHSIRGFADILKRECQDTLTENQMKYLAYIYRNASVLVEILTMLDDYIKPFRKKQGDDLTASE